MKCDSCAHEAIYAGRHRVTGKPARTCLIHAGALHTGTITKLRNTERRRK